MNNQLMARRVRYSAVSVAVLLALLLSTTWQTFVTSGVGASRLAAGCNGTITPSAAEGPYYKVGSPQRTSLIESGVQGTRLSLSGYVYDKNCQPIAGAWVDFWQTDANGVYDNSGYRMRGHQYADQQGRYRLETVVPGEYPGRTPHIHVKVKAPNGPVLTSQLYIPGAPGNNSDSIFNEALVMSVQDTPSGKVATFDFVLNVVSAQPAQTAQPTATVRITPVATVATTPSAGNNSYTFKETGITVSGEFWTVWQGGRSFQDSVYINGLPITASRDEVSPTDGKIYRTQWFERARFEYHPENQPPNNVLLGLLGTLAARDKQNLPPFRPISNPGGGLTWFSQTGHTLGDSSEGGRAIASFWNRLGGLSQFGYPISQPFMEVSKDNGKTYLVQYFERQRMEYHPENKGTPYEVLLGRLGAEQVKKTP
jgi:protocatechuate 3,4-dioxygenase beta subunit